MDLFKNVGVHCVVDGQFGSTGKGALTAWLAEQAYKSGVAWKFSGSIYSGGPNSGHTCFFEDKKIVLKQLPTFAVYLGMRGVGVPVYLSAGAIIDREILRKEAAEHPRLHIYVHPNATIITEWDKEIEATGSISEVAGTRSGTGAALARKIYRDPKAIARNSLGDLGPNVVIQEHRLKPEANAYFMEVSQGFSLGINSEFYPKVTSRECTVMQGLADARLPPRSLARTYMAIRTYPIRVGNVDGYSSGEWYFDQVETTWEKLGFTPERTTVTNRVRRVATFSMNQFYEACMANDPDVVFISHMDYLSRSARQSLVQDIHEARYSMGKEFRLVYGFGPYVQDISEAIDADKPSYSGPGFAT